MPQILNLPPVAQGVIAITAVALAIVRLLTASRPFWASTPAWAQKLLPAAMMAIAALPTAIEYARSWLDVAVAVVVSASMYWTASRGDKRPPEDKSGGPRMDRVNSDPKLTREELTPPPPPPSVRPMGGFDAELKRWRHPQWKLGAVVLLLAACSGAQPAPGCDEHSFGTLAARCSAAAAECVAAGHDEPSCGAICDSAAAEWQKRCSQ